MAGKEELSYWSAIKANDFVTLRDYQSMEIGGASGVDYRVASVRAMLVRDRDMKTVLMEYRFLDLSSPQRDTVSLLLVSGGSEFELRVYYLPDGFMSGTRDALIDHGHTWFFLPPSNPDDFISSELEYAPFPDVPPIKENGSPVKREYSFAGFGHPVFGSYDRAGQEIPVIITEYAAEDTSALNPLLLVTEERWMLPDGSVPEEGGLLTPLLGCPITTDNVEVFPA